MAKKICMITGANSGIGKEAAVQIAQAGYRAVMVCRSRERGEAALAEVKRRSGSRAVELMVADMGLQRSVCALAKAYRSSYERLDVLINNAAAFDISQKKRECTEEGIETIWETNHLGPVLLTENLMPAIKKAKGRVINIGSQGLSAHPLMKVDIDDPEFEKRRFSVSRAYYQSKLAQLMYTHWLMSSMEGTGVLASCIRVTAVKVDVDRYPNLSPVAKAAYSLKRRMALEPAEMAKIYTELATGKGQEGYIDHKGQPAKASRYSLDEAQIDRVMALTFDYVNC